MFFFNFCQILEWNFDREELEQATYIMSGPKNEILADVYSNDYICCIIYINRKVTHALMPIFAFSDTFIVRKQNCLMPVRKELKV